MLAESQVNQGSLAGFSRLLQHALDIISRFDRWLSGLRRRLSGRLSGRLRGRIVAAEINQVVSSRGLSAGLRRGLVDRLSGAWRRRCLVGREGCYLSSFLSGQDGVYGENLLCLFFGRRRAVTIRPS